MKIHTALSGSALCAVFLTGCATISPDTYKGTAIGYNTAMQETGEEQLLLNIVRLRYRDTPYFMEASSVTSQFDLSTSAGISGTFPLDADATDVLQGQGGLSFSERPTISYTPITGTEFFTRLLEPVPLENLALLANSGWSLDAVARMAIQRANGLPNAVGASGPTPVTPPRYEEFRDLAAKLFALQRTSAIQLGQISEEGESYPAIGLPPAGENPAADAVREMLGLDPALNVYRVRSGSAAEGVENGTTVEFNARSLMGVLFYLSQGVSVPRKHLESGTVTTTRDEQGEVFDWNAPLDNLFRVHHSESRPENAAASIYYRGTWFYIADDDLATKSTFMLFAQMFTLQTGDARGQTPILTIPVSN